MSFLKLTAQLGLNASGYETGLKRASSAATHFGSRIKSQFAAAFGTAAVAAWSRSVMGAVDQLLDFSQQTGASTDALQEWGYAARRNSASMEDVVRTFNTLGKNRMEALNGNEKLIQSFKALGISLNDLRTKRVNELAEAIARTVRSGDIQALTGHIQAVGSEAATKLVPAMKAFEDMRDLAHEAGQVIRNETLTAIDELSEALQDLKDEGTPIMAKLLGLTSKRVTETRIGLGAIGAFLKSMHETRGPGGSDFSKAMEEAWASFLIDLFAMADKERARSKNEEDKNKPVMTPEEAAEAEWLKTLKSHDMTPKKKGGGGGRERVDRPENLTDWQKLGASVRGMGNDPLLAETRGIHFQLKEINKKTVKPNVNRGNFGVAAFVEGFF